MSLSPAQISGVAQSIGLDYATFMAFIMTESGGTGFDENTGKPIIRFEPSWFIRKLKAFGINYTATPIYSKINPTKVNTYIIVSGSTTFTSNDDGQANAWKSFNAAWSINKTCAMLATSWGMMQVMGFNYSTCGFHTVDDFVTAMRTSELTQIQAAAQFILHNPSLLAALKAKNWKMAAYYYNGANYAENRYDWHLENHYNQYVNVQI